MGSPYPRPPLSLRDSTIARVAADMSRTESTDRFPPRLVPSEPKTWTIPFLLGQWLQGRVGQSGDVSIA